MDDLEFNENGIIPYMTLYHHLKKLFPNIEDKNIKMFITLVDTNND
jgi:hypothetical protein